jgi:hypothetical protein
MNITIVSNNLAAPRHLIAYWEDQAQGRGIYENDYPIPNFPNFGVFRVLSVT